MDVGARSDVKGSLWAALGKGLQEGAEAWRQRHRAFQFEGGPVGERPEDGFARTAAKGRGIETQPGTIPEHRVGRHVGLAGW